jgi:hypothetical protein
MVGAGPRTGQCLNGRLGWLEVECNRCKTRASLPLSAIRRAAGHANLEAGGLVQMPIVSERPLRAASAHDQADGDARDHALQMGASGTKSGEPATPRTS